MGSVSDEAPLIVIVGETASGKSALAMEITRQFDGEIICADSRTVYKGMDIGTAKPTTEDRSKVAHHLLDVVKPNEPFTVADFKRLANEAIADIHARNKLPIMVGGSGLYVDSVIYDYQFSDGSRERDAQNPRHLKRTGEPIQHRLRPQTLVMGLQLDRDVLKSRISARVEAMVAQGLVDEVKRLEKQYGRSSKAFLAPGYKAFLAYLDSELTFDQAKEQFIRSDLQLAKRQRTWFKRNKSIHWISSYDEAIKLATQFVKITVSSRA